MKLCWQTQILFQINIFLTPTTRSSLQQYIAFSWSFLALFGLSNLSRQLFSHALRLVRGIDDAIPASPPSLTFCLEFRFTRTFPFVTVNVVVLSGRAGVQYARLVRPGQVASLFDPPR